MDSSIINNSRQGLLQLFGLETTKRRVLAYGLPNIPDGEAIKDIKELLQGGEDMEREEKLEAMYLRGDLKEWEDYEWDSVKESKYINIKTAYLRNKGMLKELLAHLLQGTNTLIPLLIAVECPFIIPVGCAHLLGKGGLLMDSSIRNPFNIKRVTNEGQAVDFVYTPER